MPELSPPALPGADILLVDDRPSNLLALEAVLDGLGDCLVRAGSGEEALTLLAGSDFAVVLLDVRMPGLSGFETAQRMRASDRSRHTPVIFLSADAGDDFPVVEAYRLGAVDYLLKPLVPDVLRAKVAVFVDLYRKGERLRSLEQRERERAEAALRDSEARLRQLADNLPAGFIYQIVLDAAGAGRFTYVSGGVEPLLGVSPAEVVADSTRLYGLIHPDDFPRVRATEEEALRAGIPFDCRFRCRGRGGEARWLHCRSAPRPLPDGGSVWDGVASDITGVVRAEDELRQSEQRLLLAIDIARMGTFEIDLLTDAVTVNEPGRILYGWDTPHTTFAQVQGHFHPDDRDEVLRRVAAAFDPAGPGVFEVEQRIHRTDGEQRWIRVRGQAFFADEGTGRRAVRCLGTYLDVTDRKRDEEELRRKETELTDFVENATVGLHWVGPDGTILWANKAEFDLLGYAREEYVGRNIAEFHADPTVIEDILSRLTSNEALHGYEAQLRCKDGSVRHVLISSNVYREGGRFVHSRCFTRDVTDRKRAEERLREEYRRKDEFMAMLAHELRNPLAPLRNALQILQLRGGDPPAVERVRGMMDRQVTHLSRLVDDLLDVSRITTGKVQLRRERLDLGRVARQSVTDQQAAFDGKRVALRAVVPAEAAWVFGDPTRLAQVLDNMLANALKFTAEGGEVGVTVAGDGGEAVLSVRDTGAGIEPDMLARLFEPFSQADRTLDRSAGGLGLGLAIVKGLVELHGGAIRAESAGLGKGSTFTATLPAYVEPPALAASPPVAKPAGRRLRVLVVEDNRDAADSLRMLLEAYGYEVEVAYTGPDGVRAAGEYRPEVVICDIGLPGLDGYGVATALRGNPVTASSRLIALSGYGQDEDRRKARAAGFDEHLTKPADPAALELLLSAVS